MNPSRPLDFIIFALILTILAWQAIQYSEFDDLRRLVRTIQFREVQ
jgi:hypothetical protein